MPNSTTEENQSTVVTIEFILNSGETFTVRTSIEGDELETAINALGEQLAGEIGGDRVNTYGYWEGDDYFFDAISMANVAAFGILPYVADDADQDEDDGV
jgi:hypothetical protein